MKQATFLLVLPRRCGKSLTCRNKISQIRRFRPPGSQTQDQLVLTVSHNAAIRVAEPQRKVQGNNPKRRRRRLLAPPNYFRGFQPSHQRAPSDRNCLRLVLVYIDATSTRALRLGPRAVAVVFRIARGLHARGQVPVLPVFRPDHVKHLRVQIDDVGKISPWPAEISLHIRLTSDLAVREYDERLIVVWMLP